MPQPFKGKIELDIRDSTPDWDAFSRTRPPVGAECYGSASWPTSDSVLAGFKVGMGLVIVADQLGVRRSSGDR